MYRAKVGLRYGARLPTRPPRETAPAAAALGGGGPTAQVNILTSGAIHAMVNTSNEAERGWSARQIGPSQAYLMGDTARSDQAGKPIRRIRHFGRQEARCGVQQAQVPGRIDVSQHLRLRKGRH